MKADIAPAGIRFPPELKDELHRAAHKNKRSMNSEVVARIAASFEGKAALRDVSDGDLIDEFIRRWGREAVDIKISLPHKNQESNCNK